MMVQIYLDAEQVHLVKVYVIDHNCAISSYNIINLKLLMTSLIVVTIIRLLTLLVHSEACWHYGLWEMGENSVFNFILGFFNLKYNQSSFGTASHSILVSLLLGFLKNMGGLKIFLMLFFNRSESFPKKSLVLSDFYYHRFLFFIGVLMSLFKIFLFIWFFFFIEFWTTVYYDCFCTFLFVSIYCDCFTLCMKCGRVL